MPTLYGTVAAFTFIFTSIKHCATGGRCALPTLHGTVAAFTFNFTSIKHCATGGRCALPTLYGTVAAFTFIREQDILKMATTVVMQRSI